jgi:hypothetical protein
MAWGSNGRRVGLLNNGTEEHKGRPELKVAHDLIATNADGGAYDFVGFVEGGDIPSSRVDVIVTDGFTGNVALKTGEGTAALIRDFLKDAFKATPLSRIAAVLALSSLKRLHQQDRPAPRERRGVSRSERHGGEIPRIGRRHRNFGGHQARLRAGRIGLQRPSGRPGCIARDAGAGYGT